MNRDRFDVLAAAYGGDLARWPVHERDAARAWLAGDREAEARLDEERTLDACLDAYRVSEPQADQQRRVATAMLQAAATPRRVAQRFAAWLALGSVGALSAGALVGGVLVSALPRGEPAYVQGVGALYEQSSFGDLTGPEEDASS